MTLIGLDLNATRARAIQGESPAAVPRGLALDGRERELPLALSLEERKPRVGRDGAGLCRRSPHLACLDFLPHIGDGRTWDAGRHRLDAAAAVALVCEQLQRRLGSADGLTAALPAYLSSAQAALLANLANKSRWPLLGSVPAPIAVALAAHEHLPWSGLAVVLDLDGHALTWSAVAVRDEVARVLHVQPVPQLARGAWLGRMLDGAAVRCVRLSRRDPRESAETEQALYDQLAALVDGPADGAPAEVILQTPHWYQHLTFSPSELTVFCAPLVQRAVAQTQQFLATRGADATPLAGAVGAILLTGPAGRLPGLVAALDALIARPESEPPPNDDRDFGESLVEESALSPRIHVLDDDAVARAAFELALRQHRGELPRGHIDAASLPGSGAANDAAAHGPARLHYRGEDHPLSAPLFTLGRDPTCNLIFESEMFPTVSARHCEVALVRGAYQLRDRSRHGTLVNDCLVTQPTVLHSGDWIRLGPGGPLVRFLGRPTEQRSRMTIA